MTTEADALKFTAEQAVTANGKRIIESAFDGRNESAV